MQVSLLDAAGHLNTPVSSGQIGLWRNRLHRPGVSLDDAALLQIKLGEVQLAKDEQPQTARASFVTAAKMLSTGYVDPRRIPGSRQHPRLSAKNARFLRPLRGLAAYDTAIALFYEGRYARSAAAFKHLLTARPSLVGFDRRDASMFYRHASACAGYHAERAKMSITEPDRLDPLCGAEALAACLRGQGRPFDKKTLLANCRVTGRGSNLEDILVAAKKLGMDAKAVTATDAGLINLPKPAVGFVEHDHFVAVLRADARSVSYLCSDCGAWPGGQRTLNWKQWHKMEAVVYAAVTKPGSAQSRWVEDALAKRLQEPALPGRTRLAACLPQIPGGGGIDPSIVPPGSFYCGFSIAAPQCCPQPCPMDCPALETSGGVGPMRYDPVNLATGQEEYGHDSDLNVYNPVGPYVTWSRIYNSLRGHDDAYQSDDFGAGWSHPYNTGVFDPAAKTNIQVPQGGSVLVSSTGSDAPGNGAAWDIVLNGTVIASSASPNGWALSSSYSSPTVTAPASAASAQNYEWRSTSPPYNFHFSGFFDVIPVGSVPAGGSVQLSVGGTEAPANGQSWDIVSSGTVISTAAQPHGWVVSYTPYSSSGPAITVTAPINVPLGAGYKARIAPGQSQPASVSFSVIASRLQPMPGAKYVFEPNGARLTFTASAVPTAAQPHITCSVQAGVPITVTWDYDAGSAFDHYTITTADRTKWTTTSAVRAVTPLEDVFVTNNIPICYVLAQQSDRMGNAINFVYGSSGASTFPLLSSITDKNGQALLTLNRSGDGSGNLISVGDRYGRSIYYHTSTYPTQNVPIGRPQSQQELDHVSQIVPTGTPSPPDRIAYGYQSVGNGEGSETVPMLHTITIPSSTGAGTATATINYSNLGAVSSIVDANGNVRSYTAVDANHSKVTIKDAAGSIAYAYTAGFDMNMSETGRTNGAGVYQVQKTFGNPNDPFHPSQVTNANGQSTSYNWDQYGNCLTATTPRNTTTTYTFSYASFPLGELTQAQEGGKTATSLTYYQPSGLPQSISSAKPGTAGAGQTVTTTYHRGSATSWNASLSIFMS